MKALTWCGIVLALLVASASPVTAKKREKAGAGFKAIQEAAKKPEGNAEALETIFPAGLVKDRPEWTEEKTKAWREGWVARFADAKLLSATETDERAWLRLGGRTKETELLVRLKHDGERWILDCPEVYLAKGRLLDTANGSGAARVTVKARQKNGPYEGSAYSFPHVTSDPEECKNRMDVWFCKFGDLHANGDGLIAVIGTRRPLAKVKEVDAAWEWRTWVEPVAGTTYAVRCRRDHGVDFFVTMKVVEVREATLTFEWQILAAGPGSPPSIHKPNPLVSNDGADGYAGMCGGKQSR